jgi:hypothetical protein
MAVALPVAIISWVFHGSKGKQVQKSGTNSTNIQVGGNFTINSKNNDK